ncbi:MAG: IS91 family transposase [Cyanobacteria bacterium K_Offshore_surface_m2_239]|nr:IS91 family transposase [Cyanobacteria bacterium K_Offshore_surface_m2_239]
MPANHDLNLQCLVLDWVYRRTEGQPVFDEAPAPTGAELVGLLEQIVARLMKLLTRTGHLVEEQGMTYLAEADTENPLASLQAASCTYRIALGPRAGQKGLSLRTVAGQDEKPGKVMCAETHGISLHAAVRNRVDQRKQLERLCRTITRPALANERLSRNGKGRAMLRLKSPYRDGTTHIVMEPQAFMQRLAALVPRPRLHLIRYHGVLAPNAKLRAAVVPSVVQRARQPAHEHGHTHGQAARMSWAQLLKRVFHIDVERCVCGGQLKILAAIEEPVLIVRILTHLGLPARAPPRAPARELSLGFAA